MTERGEGEGDGDAASRAPFDSGNWRDAAKKTPLWRKVLPFFVAAFLLYFAFRQVDFAAFGRALGTLNYPAYITFVTLWALLLLAGDAFGSLVAYRRTVPTIRFGDFYVIRGASYLPGNLNHHVAQAYLTYVIHKRFHFPLSRMAGATLLSYAGWMGCLVGCFALALPFAGLSVPVWYTPALLGVGVAYLAVIAVKPRALARIGFLAPLFEAGILGHAQALVARLPHLFILVLGHWGAYRFFDVDIPIGRALMLLPIVMVAITLPITPQGFGTREMLGQKFFVAFAAGATEPERLGRIAASTMSFAVLHTIVGIVVGFVCMRITNRQLGEERASEAARSGEGPAPGQSSRADAAPRFDST